MSGFHISSCIEQLWRDYPHSSEVKKLHAFVLRDSWTPQDRQTILNQIARCLSNPTLTEIIAEHFCPILLDLFCRISNNSSRISLFCVLGKLIGRYACATNFSYERFGSGFFSTKELINELKELKSADLFFELDYFCSKIKYSRSKPLLSMDFAENIRNLVEN